jgi:hypothetical protein
LGFRPRQAETEILDTFPELKVLHETPEWMTPEQERNVRSESSFNIGEASSYPEWLRKLVAERRS